MKVHQLEKLSAIVGLTCRIPETAYTASILGTERSGHGVLISANGIIVTVGYVITEATEVWIKLADGRVLPGHVLGFDQDTGLGLVQALARLDVPYLALGDSDLARPGTDVLVAGAGGEKEAIEARVMGRREFSGYWEYLLDDAIFTAPAHKNWGGTAMIGSEGTLLGVGSLHVGHQAESGSTMDLNMVVPINLLKPILDDIISYGRPQRPVRPWLGVYTGEIDGRIVVLGTGPKGPAAIAGVRRGDVIGTVGATIVKALPEFYRSVWALGDAGVEVPLAVMRNGRAMAITIVSGDRRAFLKGPVMH
ncbi:MAG: S1C family serine protease [Hyphomicrobiaceae bacterium]